MDMLHEDCFVAESEGVAFLPESCGAVRGNLEDVRVFTFAIDFDVEECAVVERAFFSMCDMTGPEAVFLATAHIG